MNIHLDSKASDTPSFLGKVLRWQDALGLIIAILLIILLSLISFLIGTADLNVQNLLQVIMGLSHQSTQYDESLEILWMSRIPRTIALVLAGASLSIAGLIMQMLVRNRFVEPTTAGTAASATLGLLFVALVIPDISIFYKMLIATLFALAGTMIFVMLLRRIPLRSILMVPLLGLVFAGIIDSITTFFAYRYQLLQSLTAWTTGDFSSVISGRYELLWFGLLLSIVAYIFADRFTVAGMGKSFATNLGLNYQKIFVIGLILVAMITAVVVVTVGSIPFIGLIVPNIVAMAIGDNVRRNIPWVAVTGAILVLLCDIIGRLIRYPYEIPVGTIVGVLGCIAFLYLLLKRNNQFG